MKNFEKPRVRFAPSPTGFMHIGNFRSALYDYLFAKKTGGDFVLRIEDTDQKRFVKGALESLIKTLDWAGIKYYEGPFTEKMYRYTHLSPKKVEESKSYPGVFEVGEFGPYIQSEKLEVYKKYAEELVEKGYAYYCFCDAERLENLRKTQQAEKKAPMYDRHCLHNVSEEEAQKRIAENQPYTIRLKMPENEILEAEDIVRGKVKFDSSLVDDQVLLKSDGFPTYHLANVIDDHDMNITHVIRGEEWLPSLPKHLILYRYFGWETPKFAHLPLLLNADRSKLSKRQGDVAVEDYIKKGYLKEAIINFVAFLGWNPGEGSTQEIFTLDELAEKFELSRVHKAGAVFDLKKLDWINAQWIKKISPDELYERVLPFLMEKDFFKNIAEEKKTEEYVKKVLEIEKDRLVRLTDAGEESRFFFCDIIRIEKDLLFWKEMSDENLRASLQKSKQVLGEISEADWTRENLQDVLMRTAEENYKTPDGKVDRGALLWPLRASLTGEKKSPSPFEVAWVIGKEEALNRLDKAISII